MTEIPKAYEPKGVEERWYAFWEEKAYFRGPTGVPGDPFCVVIPPPNVTGALHFGHALNNSIQDVFVRRARMQGRPTLWLPGTDHAAIATQNVLERRLAAEGKTRFDVGREAFIELFWEWKNEYEARILGQLKRLGASCDWSRTRFTMDPGLSHAVRTVFVQLYEEGHIYRGARIINWCPRCTSAISDIEVNHIDVEGELITVGYPLEDGSGRISVSTTRVETMLGDTGIAVHPDDERYKALVGKTAVLPLVDRRLPIVADEAVDPEFGTGAVKVTPAHDPLDFEIAQRHGLDPVNIFDETATVNENGGPYAGLDRYAARKKVLEDLRAQGYVEHEERPYVHAVGHCDRCGTEIEPWLSEQWFMAMKNLARPAIDAVRDGRVRIIPQDPYERMYLEWLENIRDWCVSRQIWLGHRIPAWYCPDGHVTVSMDDPDACAECGSEKIEQDDDTLDTWFSSGLWPFSTLGWPEQTKDLAYWYPTSLLSTDRAIIYLWVVRMVFLGLHFAGDVPFRDVLIHPTVRDREGKPMSKSLGNVIDPVDVIDQYGTDALRFGLLQACVFGQDMSYADDRMEGARRFCNKLWNACRFVVQHINADTPEVPTGDIGLPERWILSRLAQTEAEVDRALDAYELADAARAIYHFIWSELCDWYVEMAKLALDGPRAEAAASTLRYVFDRALRLLHPITPFVTEELWQRLPRRSDDPESIMVAAWPQAEGTHVDTDSEAHMAFLQAAVLEIRRFRHEHHIPPRRKIDAVVNADGRVAELVENHAEELKALAWLSNVRIGEHPDGWSRVIAEGTDVYLPLADVIDVAAERSRLERDIARGGRQGARAARRASCARRQAANATRGALLRR
jgi:valyl-tRNA synthetase